MIMWYRCITYFQREAKLLGGKLFSGCLNFKLWRTQVECDCNSWSHVDTLCQSLLFLTFVCIAQIISQRIDCTVDQQRLEEWLLTENPKQGSFLLLLKQNLTVTGVLLKYHKPWSLGLFGKLLISRKIKRGIVFKCCLRCSNDNWRLYFRALGDIRPGCMGL